MYVPLGADCCTVLLYSKTGINIPKTLKQKQCILVCVCFIESIIYGKILTRNKEVVTEPDLNCEQRFVCNRTYAISRECYLEPMYRDLVNIQQRFLNHSTSEVKNNGYHEYTEKKYPTLRK